MFETYTYQQPPRPQRRKKPPKPSATEKALLGVVEIVITLAVMILLFVFYATVVTGWETSRDQDILKQQYSKEIGAREYLEPTLPTAPNTPTPTPENPEEAAAPEEPKTEENPFQHASQEQAAHWTGGNIGIVTVPRWGKDWEWVIIHGTKDEDIRKGPGWYEDTQKAGERGNMAIAAHESGFNAPFSKIWETLPTCSEVKIETKTARYTYKVLPHNDNDTKAFENCAPQAAPIWKQHYRTLNRPVFAVDIVNPSQYEIVHPIPMAVETHIPDWAMPILTLQTCYPHLQSTERAVVRAALTSVEVKK